MSNLNPDRCHHGVDRTSYCFQCASSGIAQIGRNLNAKVVEIKEKASKNDQEKADLSLIPYCALLEEAKALQVGERKYGRYNYTKGHKASQLIAAAMRHLAAWNNGETNDPIDGQSHLGSVRATMAMLIHQIELGTLNDDRYTTQTKDKKNGIS